MHRLSVAQPKQNVRDRRVGQQRALEHLDRVAVPTNRTSGRGPTTAGCRIRSSPSGRAGGRQRGSHTVGHTDVPTVGWSDRHVLCNRLRRRPKKNGSLSQYRNRFTANGRETAM